MRDSDGIFTVSVMFVFNSSVKLYPPTMSSPPPYSTGFPELSTLWRMMYSTPSFVMGVSMTDASWRPLDDAEPSRTSFARVTTDLTLALIRSTSRLMPPSVPRTSPDSSSLRPRTFPIRPPSPSSNWSRKVTTVIALPFRLSTASLPVSISAEPFSFAVSTASEATSLTASTASPAPVIKSSAALSFPSCNSLFASSNLSDSASTASSTNASLIRLPLSSRFDKLMLISMTPSPSRDGHHANCSPGSALPCTVSMNSARFALTSFVLAMYSLTPSSMRSSLPSTRTSVSWDESTIELMPFHPWARSVLLNARTSAAETRNVMRRARMVRSADFRRCWMYSSVTVVVDDFLASSSTSVAGTASSTRVSSASSAALDWLRDATDATPPTTTFPALLTLSATTLKPFFFRSSSFSRLSLVGRPTGLPAHQPQKTWRKQHPPFAMMDSCRTVQQQSFSPPPTPSASPSSSGAPLPLRRPRLHSLKQQSILPTLRRSSQTPHRT